MITMTYKKFLLILCLCTFVFPHAFAMDANAKRMKEFEAAIKGNGPKNTAQLRSMAAELSQDPKNYKKIALLTHPDRNNGNTEIAELFKAAQECYSKKHRATVITANDINEVNEETQKSKELFDSIQQYSIPTATLAATLQQGQQELSHAFIDNVIGTAFTLISDKLMTRHTEDSIARKNVSILRNGLNTLKNNQDTMNDSLQMHTEYRADLQQLKTKTDQKNQEKLRNYLNKENK